MEAQRAALALWTSAAGVAGTALTRPVSAGPREMASFWHQEQSRLQPSVPKENARLPGRKWYNGFFSTGSACRAATPSATRVRRPGGAA